MEGMSCSLLTIENLTKQLTLSLEIFKWQALSMENLTDEKGVSCCQFEHGKALEKGGVRKKQSSIRRNDI